MTEAKGIPVAVVVTGANRHDMKKLAALLDATVVEPAPTEPPHLALDRGYDYDDCRDAAIARGYTAHIPPTGAARPRCRRDPDRSGGEHGPYGVGVATVGVPAVVSSSSVMIPSWRSMVRLSCTIQFSASFPHATRQTTSDSRAIGRPVAGASHCGKGPSWVPRQTT